MLWPVLNRRPLTRDAGESRMAEQTHSNLQQSYGKRSKFVVCVWLKRRFERKDTIIFRRIHWQISPGISRIGGGGRTPAALVPLEGQMKPFLISSFGSQGEIVILPFTKS